MTFYVLNELVSLLSKLCYEKSVNVGFFHHEELIKSGFLPGLGTGTIPTKWHCEDGLVVSLLVW